MKKIKNDMCVLWKRLLSALFIVLLTSAGALAQYVVPTKEYKPIPTPPDNVEVIQTQVGEQKVGVPDLPKNTVAAEPQKTITAEPPQDDMEVIETRIGIDQAVETEPEAPVEKPAPAPRSKKGNEPAPSSDQILRIDKSLKNAISENKKLEEDRKKLEEQIKILRGQREIDYNRVNSLTTQRDQLIQRTVEVEDENKKHSEELEQLKKSLEEKEAEVKKQSKELNKNIEIPTIEEAMYSDVLDPDAARKQDKNVAKFKKINYHNIISKAGRVNRINERLKKDSAKIHYNLGNIFFHRGEYERAADEYRESVTLMPYDAASHFNLAFVCSEFLNDQQTALEHYQFYLYLNPGAEDSVLVKEKILAARLSLRDQIDSPIDKEKMGNKNKIKKGDDVP